MEVGVRVSGMFVALMMIGWSSPPTATAKAKAAAQRGPIAEPASDPGPAADAPIIVTGARPTRERLENRASAYVRAVSALPVSGQYARWNEPVCPVVIGVGARPAGVVADRIRAVAGASGAAVGKPGCKANVVVTFTGDARDLMARLVKKEPGLLRQAAAEDRRRITSGPGPVRWWYGTRTEGAEGRPIAGASSALLLVQDFPTGDEAGFLDSYHSSLIDTKLRVSMTGVSVVVDVPAATGVTLGALGAYVAFVALARVRMARDAGGDPSILDLFAGPPGTDRPRDLTDWDRAYLAALYAVPVNRPARVQRARVVGDMAGALGGR